MNSGFLSILVIAVGLSADCFAVALGSGVSRKRYSRLQILVVALSFGLFQALMPALGWLAGKTVIDFIAGFDHWVAFALLAFVGGKMLLESFRRQHDQTKETDITKGLILLTLSVATSIDALAVGLSFAFLNVNIAVASPTIGIVAALVTAAGFVLGRKAGGILGKRAELLGGVILVAIAFRVLLSHIL
jgi:putative Mn2+ efflux pump MntP